MGTESAMRHGLRRGAALVPLLAFALLPAAGDTVLVKDAQVACILAVTDDLRAETNGVYVIAPKDGRYVDIAIAELTEHLGLVAAGPLAVTNAPSARVRGVDRERGGEGLSVVFLGGPGLDAELAEALRQPREGGPPDPESFAIEASNGVVKIVGLTPKGMLNGVYELLEQLGFRWFMPGEIGRVVPDSDSLSIVNQRLLDIPSFRGRQVSGSAMNPFGAWSRRMRNGQWSAISRHGIPPLQSSGLRRTWFEADEAHHQHFALRGGERSPGQLCVSNPEVLKLAVDAAREYFRANPDAEFYGMGPNDGSGFCECEDCRALDGGEVTPFTDRVSVTDRYFWFYNQVLKGIEDEFPHARIGTLIYSDTMMPPVKVRPDPRIVGRVALIHLCRIHSPLNPVCPEARAYLRICEQWQAAGVALYDAGYWFNLADPGLPFMMIHRVRDEIPLIHELGHLGISRAPAAQWANEGPSLYLAHKLMWDADADVDTLLDDYFDTFYGPASTSMRRYILGLDAALRDGDHHTGRSWDLLHIYDDNVRSMARKALAEARRRAGKGIYGTRVRIAAEGWEYFEAFADMVESRRRHDYVQSMRALERTRERVARLTTAYDKPMLRVSTKAVSAEGFLDRLYARVTEEAYARVTGGNTLAVGLGETWAFLQDPQRLGESIGLYREAVTGGNWQKMNTSLSWGSQGLRYYFGEAWYRQDVMIPTMVTGTRTMLWFAGVDDAAKVWINGTLIGTSPGAAFDIDAHGGSSAPFEFDVSDVLRPGERNAVVVRVNRSKVNELGTGGIMGPVMFYTAASE